MAMKDSTIAKELEEQTDNMTISLMKTLKELDVAEMASKVKSSTPENELNTVLTFYTDIIEQLGDIAENISKTVEVEENHAGTLFMGSTGEGTYLPEITETFDGFVMEEDSQFEMQEDLEVIHSEEANKDANPKRFLKVMSTGKIGFFFIVWTEYGLELKTRHEARCNASGGPVDYEDEDYNLKQTSSKGKPIFSRLVEYTEDIEYKGEKIQVVSPFKIRQSTLSHPPSSIQGYPTWFRMKDQNCPAVTLMTEELKESGQVKKTLVIDLVLTIRTTMPSLSEQWINHKKSSSKWLSNDFVSKLQEIKSYIVAKSWEKAQDNLFLWRISYSKVERQCIKLLPREPKLCLIILKAIRRKFLSEPTGLASYHLKTILFNQLDKRGSDWKSNERARNLLEMLELLADALKVKSLPLYFEPGINTLEGRMEDEAAAALHKKTREILSFPGVLMKGILFQTVDDVHDKKHFQRSADLHDVWFDEKPPEPKMFEESDLQQ